MSSPNSQRLDFNLTKKTCLKTTCILGLNLKLPVCSQTGSHTWRAWRHLGERHCSRLVGGKVNKQGALHARLVLGNRKTSRSLCTPTGILKAYVEALTGFNLIYHPDSLNNTLLSQGHVLENSSHCGNDGQDIQSRIGKGVRSLCQYGSCS